MLRAPLYRASGSPGSSWKMKKLANSTNTSVPRRGEQPVPGEVPEASEPRLSALDPISLRWGPAPPSLTKGQSATLTTPRRR